VGNPNPNLGKFWLPRCPTQCAVNELWNFSKMFWVTEIGLSISVERIGGEQTTLLSSGKRG
jgi:hypothetical protein